MERTKENTVQAFLKAFAVDERNGKDPLFKHTQGLARIAIDLDSVSAMVTHTKKLANKLYETTTNLLYTAVKSEQERLSARQNYKEEEVGTQIEEEVEENERTIG